MSTLTVRLRRRWFALVGKGSLLLLLAFLPTVMYIGHWNDLVNSALGHPAVERAADDEHTNHAAHCHGSQAACSDQPVPTGANVIASVVELPYVEMTARAAIDDALVFQEFIFTPPTEPPRL